MQTLSLSPAPPLLAERTVAAALPRAAWPALAVCALLLSIPLAAVAGGYFRLSIHDLGPPFVSIAILFACAARLRGQHVRILPDLITAFAIYFSLELTVALSTAVLAATDLPYADGMLAKADAALGFRWPAMAAGLVGHVFVQHILHAAYDSLNTQPLLLVILLCCYRPPAVVYRFMTAAALALLATALIFPFFPAAAAYAHFHLDPAMLPASEGSPAWGTHALMDDLRSGTMRTLGRAVLEGLVTMPSFHAAAAVLLGWGWWSFRLLRWPAVVLNLLMIASAMPVGGHYLVDVIAGLAIAGLSIPLTTALEIRKQITLPL